jgi:hypothetical protein
MSLPRNMLMLAITTMLVFGVQHSFATPSLEVSTSKKVYEYGDFLSINFQVSELTSNTITIHITDSSNKTSTAINLPMSKLNTTITSPLPFYKINFSPGTYRIDAQYSNVIASTSFDLVDSGKIVIPMEFKSLVKTLVQGSATDKAYAGIIHELINDKVLDIPNYNNQTSMVHIPQWFQNNIKWWADDSISDNEFGISVEYLIQKGIMQV